MRIRTTLTTALIAAALIVPLGNAAANAAPARNASAHHNVLGTSCNTGPSKYQACIRGTEEHPVIVIKTPHRRTVLRTQRAAVKWFGSHRSLAPTCQYEDSDACYWNASVDGNGLGDSFIVIGNPGGEAATDRHGHHVNVTLFYFGDMDK